MDKYFKEYPENIIGFRVNGEFKLIDFWFKHDWVIPEDFKHPSMIIEEQEGYKDKTMVYYIIATSEQTFDTLYSQLSAIFEYNIVNEQKLVLFNQKVEELQTLFLKGDIESLKNISFLKNENKPGDKLKEKLSASKPAQLPTSESTIVTAAESKLENININPALKTKPPKKGMDDQVDSEIPEAYGDGETNDDGSPLIKPDVIILNSII